MKKVIALTGGGTWGHTFPLLAIKRQLAEDKDLEFHWFGEADS